MLGRSQADGPKEAADLFYVDTPLQLLNALEATFALSVTRAVLVVCSDRLRGPQLSTLVDDGAWDSVMWVNGMRHVDATSSRVTLYRSMMLVRRQLDVLARRVGAVDRLFLGNYGSPLGRHLASVLEHNRLILLDDGTATIQHAAARESGSPSVPRRRLRRNLRDRALGIRRSEADAVTFFTTFDVVGGDNDSVVRNTFHCLRASMAEPSVAPEALFLGQPLVEDHQMTDEAYLHYVVLARRMSGLRDFVYAPHPRESRERVDRLCMHLGVPARLYDLPIEAEFASSGRLPAVLMSFNSSALHNCHVAFKGLGMVIKALEIPTADLHTSYGRDPTYDLLYANFRRHEGAGFEVVVLDRQVEQREDDGLVAP